jgi:hypothetical protein
MPQKKNCCHFEKNIKVANICSNVPDLQLAKETNGVHFEHLLHYFLGRRI